MTLCARHHPHAQRGNILHGSCRGIAHGDIDLATPITAVGEKKGRQENVSRHFGLLFLA